MDLVLIPFQQGIGSDTGLRHLPRPAGVLIPFQQGIGSDRAEDVAVATFLS